MKTRVIWLPVIVWLFVSSCGNYMYQSPTPKTPLFSKKNDFRCAIYNGLNETIGLYAAYSPVNYLGASAALTQFYSFKINKINEDKTLGDYEFSVIPYFPYKYFRLEMPAGIGFTRLRTSSTGYVPSTPYQRLFFQPTFGFCWNDFELGTYIRVSQLDFTDARLGKDTRNEIGLMVRGKIQYCKIMLQYRNDFGTNYSKTPAAHLLPDDQIRYYPFHVSIGVQIDLNFNKSTRKAD